MECELVELTIQAKSGRNDLQQIVTIIVAGQVQVNHQLKAEEVFNLPDGDVTVRIYEGYTNKKELLMFIFMYVLSILSEDGGMQLLFIDQAELSFTTQNAVIVHDPKNKDKIFTAPGNPSALNYRRVSTKSRLRKWLLFFILPICTVWLLLDAIILFSVVSPTARFWSLIVAVVFEGLLMLPSYKQLKQARANLI